MNPTSPEPLCIRDALVDGMAHPEGSAMRLATTMASTIRRPTYAEAGPPQGAVLDSGRPAGPWLAYLLSPDGAGCWLALGWRPLDQAAAIRDDLPLDVDDHFRLGPIGVGPERLAAAVLWVPYAAAALPPEHRMLNDLHAMVMLHDLLAEPAPAAR